MRILLTNDDGIHAQGLAVLQKIAHAISDDVWVVAPETDQSGLAHSLTLSEPLRLRAISDKTFALRGTPTDCVIMALRNVLDAPPDLILSGVNAGQNAADDVTYSGTVAAAIEGTLLGIPSIALSQASHQVDGRRTIPFETAALHAPAIVEKLIGRRPPRGVLYNVNFPGCVAEAVTGVKVAVQGTVSHGLTTEERIDGRGNAYFWLKYHRAAQEHDEGTDMHAITHNTISVTPLRLDMTAHAELAALETLFASS